MAEIQLAEEAIFKVACRITSIEARADYLQQVCGDDKALSGRVATLLRLHDQDEGFLESPAAGIPATLELPPVVEQPGTMIGPYKLVEELGEGGMGSVFMATQEEPVRRKVALKVIKPGMDSKQVIARFEAERQALAMMDHPNIAKVLDAGATDTGRPYFVMELIRGLTITEHCDQNNLNTKARIELFIDVCHAVQHAHLEGVIHRDIKPSNIIVTLVDGRPVPKVIDFGIAKATQKRLAEKTILTGDGQFLGTPQYMSPEQAGMSDLHVDVRTDIYSLGVVLYELLVGRTPFDPEQLRQAGYDEICRIIKESDPPTPSKQLSTLGAAAEETSRQRQVQPKVLWKLLHGDLDCIVMKTLEKDRDDRYATAEALADDLRRFLEDKPIEAKRPTAVERAGKWSRRHSWGVATSIAAAFAVVLAIAAMMWYGQRREAIQRERAERNLLLALDAVDQIYLKFADQHFCDFAGDRFEEQEGITPEGEEFLRRALTFYEQFAEANRGDPRVRRESATAYGRVGKILSTRGMHYKAHVALNKAVAIAEELTLESPEVTEYRRCLGEIRHLRGHALERNDNPEEALEEYREAIRLTPENSATYYSCRGALHGRMMELQQAIADFSRAIRLAPENAMLYRNRGLARLNRGDVELAVADYTEAIRLASGNAVGYRKRAMAHLAMGDVELAIADSTEAIRLDQADSKSYHVRADVYKRKGDIDEAIADYTEAIRLNPKLAAYYHNRGLAYRDKGDLETAISDLSEAIRLDRKLSLAYCNRGIAYSEKNDYAHAIADYNELIRLEPEDVDLRVKAYNNCAWLLATSRNSKLRDTNRAVELAQRAVNLAPNEGWLWGTLGAVQYHAGHWNASIDALDEHMRIRPCEDREVSLFLMAIAHWQLGNHKDAREWHKKAVAWMDENEPIHTEPVKSEFTRIRTEAAELIYPNGQEKDAKNEDD